jgi:predicted DNA-binding transcriptional regulator AlpA
MGDSRFRFAAVANGPAAPRASGLLAAPLGEALADPSRARRLDPGDAADLLVPLAAFVEALRLAAHGAGAPAPESSASAAPDCLLTPEEVAAQVGRSVDWVYRQAKKEAWKAFSRRLGRRTLRFSAAGLARHLAHRKG